MPKLSEIAKKLFLILINYFLKKQDVLFLLIYVLSNFHLSPPPPPQPHQVSKGKESPFVKANWFALTESESFPSSAQNVHF